MEVVLKEEEDEMKEGRYNLCVMRSRPFFGNI